MQLGLIGKLSNQVEAYCFPSAPYQVTSCTWVQYIQGQVYHQKVSKPLTLQVNVQELLKLQRGLQAATVDIAVCAAAQQCVLQRLRLMASKAFDEQLKSKAGWCLGRARCWWCPALQRH